MGGAQRRGCAQVVLSEADVVLHLQGDQGFQAEQGVDAEVVREVGVGGDFLWVEFQDFGDGAMAAESGLSKLTVGWIWKAFQLKPHQVDTFKLSNDPQFIDKVRDVVGLYLDPPQKALVLGVDEKSQKQALDRSAPCCR